MTIKKLSALALVSAMRRKDRVVFAAHICFALLVVALAALNVVAIERAATDGKMSPINVAAVATAPGIPATK
jgi:hypothetical protein